MIPVVLDTNVLVVGFTGRDTPPGQIMRAWRAGLFHLVTSEHILTELTRAFANDYFSRQVTANEAEQAIALLREEATVTPIIATVSGVATHPEDDFILATAVSGKAAYLVTGDTQLRKLGTFKRVTILSPAEFLGVTLTKYVREATSGEQAA
jgi:putative PIN family toxin of toxin-antitoxin system